jgi:glycosyltransferase involved in cell wall biosynthesis
MKIGFCFGPVSTGARPFDFNAIETSPRGLTGTDGSCLYYAKFMAERGHDVTLFVEKQTTTQQWGKVTVRPYGERGAVDDSWDACLAWNDVDALGVVSPKVVRIVDMQLNDFTYCKGHEYQYVDAFVSASKSLGDRLKHMGPPGHIPWFTAYNGCDTQAYDKAPKVPGRCIYASSPDRGLHILLEQWGRIREAVPHAELRVFYHSLPHMLAHVESLLQSHEWNNKEQGRRGAIIRDRINQPGVSFIGSTSRSQMEVEYSEAQLLTYPCDTVSYTEGYAVAIIEGCAAGAVPVISRCDALPEIYGPQGDEGDCCPMVDAPCGQHANEWGDIVIRLLKDEQERLRWEALGRARAKKYDYRRLAETLEGIIVGVKAKKAT